MKKKIVTRCLMHAFGKDAEQDATLERITDNERICLKVSIGDLYFVIKGDAVEAAYTMRQLEHLTDEIKRLRYEKQLDMAQIAMQRRQIDFLMGG